jgi:serine/threonine protein kinase
VGTPTYTAPEILKNEFFNEKADIYSLSLVWNSSNLFLPNSNIIVLKR